MPYMLLRVLNSVFSSFVEVGGYCLSRPMEYEALPGMGVSWVRGRLSEIFSIFEVMSRLLEVIGYWYL